MPVIAVLSDIHGNHPALLACLAHAAAHGAAEYWFLGDYLGELAYPRRTLDTLDALRKQVPCLFLRGNKEDYWLRRSHTHTAVPDTAPWRLGDSTTGMLAYNYARLTAADLDRFAALPIACTIDRPGLPPLTLCHASPARNNELLWPAAAAEAALPGFATALTIGGHSHRQGTFTAGGNTLWNPGAVGVHVGSPGKAQYLLLHAENGDWTPEFCSVGYDLSEAVREMEAEDLFAAAPAWSRVTVHCLRYGAPTNAEALRRAMALCAERTGRCDWPAVPERDWRQALSEFGIPW